MGLVNRVVAACAAVAFTTGGIARQPHSLERVAWLQGCWEASSAGRVTEEHWTGPRGGTMLGMSRTVRGTTTPAHEFLLLRERDGKLAYEAHPSGQPSAVFLSTKVTDSSVVFENLEHDFPQRIAYERRADGLTAWIEGNRGGQVRRIEYPYKRVACPGL
jgi:hypothetical protein